MSYVIVAPGLSWPKDPEILERCYKGELIPEDQRGELVTTTPGEVRDDIPSRSVPWLLEQGWIKPYNGPTVSEPKKRGGKA